RVLAGNGVGAAVGRRRVAAADLGRSDGDGLRGERIACDLLLMSGGWTPSVHLFSQSRGRLRYDAALAAYVPGEPAGRQRSAGACRGTYDLAACVAEGYAAGEAAAKAALDKHRRGRETAADRGVSPSARDEGPFVSAPQPVSAATGGRAF